MNPQVWEEVSVGCKELIAKTPWTKVLRNKFAKIFVQPTLLHLQRSGSTERSNLREGRLPLILKNAPVFNFAMDVILVIEELCFITEWMQKIKLCA